MRRSIAIRNPPPARRHSRPCRQIKDHSRGNSAAHAGLGTDRNTRTVGHEIRRWNESATDRHNHRTVADDFRKGRFPTRFVSRSIDRRTGCDQGTEREDTHTHCRSGSLRHALSTVDGGRPALPVAVGSYSLTVWRGAHDSPPCLAGVRPSVSTAMAIWPKSRRARAFGKSGLWLVASG
jgi:hypothetical protein